MTIKYHNTLKEIKIYADWTGNGAKIVLAKKGESFYCLWGGVLKYTRHLTPVKCITASGKRQGLAKSLKLFHEMIKNTAKVNITQK